MAHTPPLRATGGPAMAHTPPLRATGGRLGPDLGAAGAAERAPGLAVDASQRRVLRLPPPMQPNAAPACARVPPGHGLS